MDSFPTDLTKKNYEEWLAKENARLQAVTAYTTMVIEKALVISNGKYYVDSLLADSLAKFVEAMTKLIDYNNGVNSTIATNLYMIAPLYGTSLSDLTNEKLEKITGKRFKEINSENGNTKLTTSYGTQYDLLNNSYDIIPGSGTETEQPKTFYNYC